MTKRFVSHRPLVMTLILAAGGLASGQDSQDSPEDDSASRVVFVATPHDVVAKMLSLVRLSPDDVVYDLGCGDGRIVVEAARKYGCSGVGFDIESDRVQESRRNAQKYRVEKLVDIQQRDVFTVDLSAASVITLYLLPEMNVRLIPQFAKMKPGSRIVAHDYGIAGTQPDQTISMTSKEDGTDHWIYVWTIPLKMADEEP